MSLRYDYESMIWVMFRWVLKYAGIEIWIIWFVLRKWPDEMFMFYEKVMCWKHDHESKYMMIWAKLFL
jgi:predicted enzyme related to lactoylglutathione lyase